MCMTIANLKDSWDSDLRVMDKILTDTLTNKTDQRHDLQMHLYSNEQNIFNNAGSKTG